MLTDGLARGLSPTGAAGRLALLLGHLHMMVRREPTASRGAGPPGTTLGTGPTDREKSATHQLRKGEQGWNNATMKRTNWTKFTQNNRNFIRNSYEYRTNVTETFLLTHMFSIFVRMRFVRNSYELCTNFT